MNKQQLAAKIQALIAARDENGANVQAEIDTLFVQFEEICDFSNDAIHAAHAAAVTRMG